MYDIKSCIFSLHNRPCLEFLRSQRTGESIYLSRREFEIIHKVVISCSGIWGLYIALCQPPVIALPFKVIWVLL